MIRKQSPGTPCVRLPMQALIDYRGHRYSVETTCEYSAACYCYPTCQKQHLQIAHHTHALLISLVEKCYFLDNTLFCRLIAMSLVPVGKLVYGSDNGGRTVYNN